VLEGMTLAAGPWNSSYEERYRRLCQLMDYASTLPGGERDKAYAQLFTPFVALRVARICAWLRRPQTRPPEAFVGHAILVWKLTGKEIDEALTGPVPADDAEWESFLKSSRD